VPRNEVIGGLWRRLFGRRGTSSPAETWLSQRRQASPEEVIRQHFEAMAAHDLDWMLATMAPERARLYGDARTTDKRRLTVQAARVLAMEPALERIPLPAFSARYRETMVLRVEFEMELAPQEQRRDPTLREGRQWSFYALVREGQGKPWLIADWGT